ncbi:MAG TPA: PrgI family protein [Candidatus Saccharimonadales bacterium]|nr:PrgI family protein [Candidatus Saccharimonadales bacterium]
MATYKVPQDVEAEDKLLGPFSFRQFVYLAIALGAAVIAFFLFRVFPLLFLIPLPITIFFGALALPLRKDQPMETYLLAIVRFNLKPKLRKWDPEGVISYVEIIAPKLMEKQLTKEYGADSAQERLDYLARVMDSRGWAHKGVETTTNPSVTATVAAEARSTVDVLDEDQALSRTFKELMDQKAEEQRQAAIEMMKKAQTEPALATPVNINYNPYPTSMHQKVILPAGQQKPAPVAQKPAMTPPVSPDIIRLANSNLKVSTIAHEIQKLELNKGAVVDIKLH